MQVRATIHGAVSLVNAIATWKGATIGIASKVEATLRSSSGSGVLVVSENKNLSSKLINKVVELVVPKKELEKNKLEIEIKSEIPTGYGLKSSSAISTVVSLACHKMFKASYSDAQVLNAGIDASIATGVSMTGAFDDACGCYFGNIVVTDNKSRKIIRMEKAPQDLQVVIFVPKSRKRENIKKLKTLAPVFQTAWNFASAGDYWNAMVLNGLATSHIFNSEAGIILKMVSLGALGASPSGNGPAIAVVAKKGKISSIKKVFAEYEGRIITTKLNNKKADVYEL